MRLLNWLDKSTCNFLAVKTIKEELENKGFERLDPRMRWSVKENGRYYVTHNDSAIFAFVVGNAPAHEGGFRIISAHSDSPCFKIKPNAEIYGEGGVISLNVEKYGGGIMYTWFDRPLSISGRVMVKGEDAIHPKTLLVDLDAPVATIPHLAIHFNRAVNEGNALSVQKDMKPVLGYFTAEELERFRAHGGAVRCIVADKLGISPEDIIEYELSLYPFEKAGFVGVDNQYFQSGRIDDLSMAFAGMEALLDECDKETAATRVLAVFDNEETGSGTKQGAHSPVLRNVLHRLVSVQGGDQEDFYRAVANSFMISADDAHAWHPNYNEKYDPTNHAVIGGGPVVKINANCKYMTDADSSAVFKTLADEAGVKCQYFVNHGDVAGGSTLGNIFTGQMEIRGVDMGAAIWAMHSAKEIAGVADHEACVKVFSQFFK